MSNLWVIAYRVPLPSRAALASNWYSDDTELFVPEEPDTNTTIIQRPPYWPGTPARAAFLYTNHKAQDESFDFGPLVPQPYPIPRPPYNQGKPYRAAFFRNQIKDDVLTLFGDATAITVIPWWQYRAPAAALLPLRLISDLASEVVVPTEGNWTIWTRPRFTPDRTARAAFSYLWSETSDAPEEVASTEPAWQPPILYRLPQRATHRYLWSSVSDEPDAQPETAPPWRSPLQYTSPRFRAAYLYTWPVPTDAPDAVVTGEVPWAPSRLGLQRSLAPFRYLWPSIADAPDAVVDTPTTWPGPRYRPGQPLRAAFPYLWTEASDLVAEIEALAQGWPRLRYPTPRPPTGLRYLWTPGRDVPEVVEATPTVWQARTLPVRPSRAPYLYLFPVTSDEPVLVQIEGAPAVILRPRYAPGRPNRAGYLYLWNTQDPGESSVIVPPTAVAYDVLIHLLRRRRLR